MGGLTAWPPGAPSLWLPAAAGALALAALLAAALVRRARTAERRRIRRALRRLSLDVIEDALVPDGVGGTRHIDRLLLTRRGVLALDLRPYPGKLFGAERIEYWTQVTRGGSFRFANPLPEVRLTLQVLRPLLPGVPLQGRVVFTGEGWFAGEAPPGVSRLETLERDLGPLAGGEPPAGCRQAWDAFRERLRAVAEADAGAGTRAGLAP